MYVVWDDVTAFLSTLTYEMDVTASGAFHHSYIRDVYVVWVM